jgi:hypothetical protein
MNKKTKKKRRTRRAFTTEFEAALVQRLARHSDLAITQRYADHRIDREAGNSVETAVRATKR